jgi:hypothetical protein
LREILMTETQLLTTASALLAAMFGLLTAVLGWVGSRMYGKLDEVVKALGNVKDELHERITTTDRRHTDNFADLEHRVVALETRCTFYHKKD